MFAKEIGSSAIPHFCGAHTDPERLRNIYGKLKIKSVVKQHEVLMNYAWSCSDVAVTRAGASTIAEQLAFEIPVVYIPYPKAADNHQYLNALFIVNEVRGGELIPENTLNESLFIEKILAILSKKSTNSIWFETSKIINGIIVKKLFLNGF